MNAIKKNLKLIFILSLLLFTYNNCRFSDQSVSITSMVGGGNGSGYDGKPDPGTYIRQVYGASCSGDIIAQLKVSEDKVELLKRTFLNCYESTINLVFNQLEYYKNFKEVIGFEGGIYLNSENYKKGFVPELWCRTEEGNNQRHHLFLYNPYTKELKTRWIIGENEFQEPNTTRSVIDKSATYENSKFKLTVDLATEVLKGGKNYAATVFDKSTKLTTNLSCISGSNTLPENKIFDLSDVFRKLDPTANTGYRFSKKYNLGFKISPFDNGTSYIAVFDLNTARMKYEYRDPIDDGYILTKPVISNDEKYLYQFDKYYLTQKRDRLRLLNFEDMSEKVINLGDFTFNRYIFDNDTYIGISGNLASTNTELKADFVIFNKQTSEFEYVDSLIKGDFGKTIISNDKYIFYTKTIFKEDYLSLPLSERILNYQLVAFNFQTKEKKSLNIDASFNIKLQFLPSTSIPIAYLSDKSYPAQLQSKFFLFDEPTEKFEELKMGPYTSIFGGFRSIIKDPKSNNFYFKTTLLPYCYFHDNDLFRINLDEKKVYFQFKLVNTCEEKFSIDFFNDSLLYHTKDANGLHINRLVNLNDGSFIASWESTSYESEKYFLQNFKGMHFIEGFKYIGASGLFTGGYRSNYLVTFKKTSESWETSTVIDAYQDLTYQNLIASKNFDAFIYTKLSESPGYHQIQFKRLSTNKVIDLAKIKLKDPSMKLSQNEKFLYIYGKLYNDDGSFKEYKAYILPLPSE